MVPGISIKVVKSRFVTKDDLERGVPALHSVPNYDSGGHSVPDYGSGGE